MSLGDIRGRLLLPDDVLVIPADDLAEGDRIRIEISDEEFAISRRFARSPSKVVGPHSAALLEHFREAGTIVDAVRAMAIAEGLDPRELLRESYPFLRSCVAARILVSPESPLSERIVPIFVPGDDLDGFSVVRCVAVLDDTEIYQARDPSGSIVAVKILRPGCADWIKGALKNEARVLELLGGGVAPRLHRVGVCDGRDYLALEWCPGASPRIVADEMRAEPGVESDRELLELGRAIIEVYTSLHERGFLHGDVNPGNLVVDHDKRVRLIDFGFGSRVDEVDAIARGGTSYYLDPEHAAARLAGEQAGPGSIAGEQYSLGALLFLLVAGKHTQDFSARREDLLREICEEPPLPFAARGARPWPKLEVVLGRTLAKDPSERFPTTRALLDAWNAVEPRRRQTQSKSGPIMRSLSEHLQRVERRIRLDGPHWTDGVEAAPTTSVAAGSAGIAYALYRLACLDGSEEHLAGAEAWIGKAESELDSPQAFLDSDAFTLDRIGEISPFHTRCGVHAVRALVSQAACDAKGTAGAVRRFLASLDGREGADDLWLGRPGVLLACANLLPAVDAVGVERDSLVGTADNLAEALAVQIASRGPVLDCAARPNYGMAHGWAGELYAALRWSSACEQSPPEWIRPRLDELRACGEPRGRGLRWPWRDHVPETGAVAQYSAGWCNGSAGQVFLWVLASTVYEDDGYLDVARRAAWDVWESRTSTPHLCCGLAGMSYALLDLYRATQNEVWRDRALALARRAVAGLENLRSGPDARFADLGLYRGDLGVALLCAEFRRPEASAMPFFADEGWRCGTTREG